LPEVVFDARISLDGVIERVLQVGVGAGRRCSLAAVAPVLLVTVLLTLPMDWRSHCA
jgi:hypothetical protein